MVYGSSMADMERFTKSAFVLYEKSTNFQSFCELCRLSMFCYVNTVSSFFKHIIVCMFFDVDAC